MGGAKDKSNDLLVRKEAILEFISPKPSDATFYRWVNEDRVVSAGEFRGYYLLNATRKKLGLEPVDVKTFMEHRSSNESLYRYVWLIFHAACSFKHGLVVNCKPWYPEPEYYTLQDKDKFEKIMDSLTKSWTKCGGEDQHPYFISHMMIGVDLLAELLVPPEKIPNNQRMEEIRQWGVFGPPPTCHPLDAE